MRVTEVKIFPVRNPPADGDAGVVAYASIVLDDAFAVKDLKLFRTRKPRILVCMPSRERMVTCIGCGGRVGVTARYCHLCGESKKPMPSGDRMDVAHPIDKECRDIIDAAVVAAYQKEVA